MSEDWRKEEKSRMYKFLGEYCTSLIESEQFPLDAILMTAVADLLKDLTSVVLDRDAWSDDTLHDWCMDNAYYLCTWDKEDKDE